MIQTIQPAQATRLLEALKEELAHAKAAGPDTPSARTHYARAEQIKQVLVSYRQQQQQRTAARNAAAANSTNGMPASGGVGPGSAPVGNSMNNGPTGAGFAQRTIPRANVAQSGATSQAPASQGVQGDRASGNPPVVTAENYNEVRGRLQDLERKIRALEAGKRPDMSAAESAQIDTQLQELRLNYGQCSKFALYMKNKLMEQARSAGSPAPARAGSPATPALAGSPANPSAPPSAHLIQGGTPQGVSTPAVTNALVAASNANAVQETSGVENGLGAAGAGTPARGASKGPSPGSKESLVVPGVNLLQVTKPVVPLMPISNTINVKPVNPVTLKLGANNVRPTLSGGGASGIGPLVGTPAIVRMPTFDMASTGPIPDNAGRVLTKRKLTELINTIGADEGDGKTTIDGDVEELLLDLADEFVSSVTTFACRLAKHRKSDAVDLRDVQLHLERNWNLRIPGHSMDEVRGMRKWQPSSSYNQKVSGVEIAKAVNGNIN